MSSNVAKPEGDPTTTVKSILSGSNDPESPTDRRPKATIIANDGGDAAVVAGGTTQAVGRLTILEGGATALVETPESSDAAFHDPSRPAQRPTVTHTIGAISTFSAQNAPSVLEVASSSAIMGTTNAGAIAAPGDDSHEVPGPATTFSSHTISRANEAGEVAIDGVALKPSSTTVQYGTYYSYGSQGIVIGDTTIPTSVIPAAPTAWTGAPLATDASQHGATGNEVDIGQSMSVIGVVQPAVSTETKSPSQASATLAVLTVGSELYTQDSSSHL